MNYQPRTITHHPLPIAFCYNLSVSWITLKTTPTRWEAELMQQVLAAHHIPSRILDLGMASYFGAGSPAALQVYSEDRWNALLLLSPVEGEDSEEEE